MIRKEEVFKKKELLSKDAVSNTPKKLYPQERDWTCAFACIRTMLSSVEEEVLAEDVYVERYQLTPGPYYSKDIKAREVLKDCDVLYGCDYDDIEIDFIIDLMKKGYYIMLESMVNYAHWMVLLGYYPSYDFTDMEKSKMLFFDPYYNEVKLLNADEFVSMWIDGNYANTKVEKDFIAIKANK